MNKQILASVLSFNILISISCQQPKTEATPTVWCVLIDMSGVRELRHTRDQYAANFQSYIKKINPGDKLYVALITESSVTEPSFIVNYNFESFAPKSTNKEIRKQQEKKHLKKFQTARDSIMAKVTDFIKNDNRITPKTEILSALHVAADIFSRNPGFDRQLLLLSDMEEYSSRYSFPSENLTDNRIQSIIKEESKSPQSLPALSGVHVKVAGAHSKNSDRFFRIKNFWLAYFKASGAVLLPEDYGAALPE